MSSLEGSMRPCIFKVLWLSLWKALLTYIPHLLSSHPSSCSPSTEENLANQKRNSLQRQTVSRVYTWWKTNGSWYHVVEIISLGEIKKQGKPRWHWWVPPPLHGPFVTCAPASLRKRHPYTRCPQNLSVFCPTSLCGHSSPSCLLLPVKAWGLWFHWSGLQASLQPLVWTSGAPRTYTTTQWRLYSTTKGYGVLVSERVLVSRSAEATSPCWGCQVRTRCLACRLDGGREEAAACTWDPRRGTKKWEKLRFNFDKSNSHRHCSWNRSIGRGTFWSCWHLCSFSPLVSGSPKDTFFSNYSYVSNGRDSITPKSRTQET